MHGGCSTGIYLIWTILQNALPEQMILNTLLQASVSKRNPSWFPHDLGRDCHIQTFCMIAQNTPMGSSLRLGRPCWLWGSSGRDYSLLYLYDPTQGLAHSRSGYIFHSATCFSEYIWPCHSLPQSPPMGTRSKTQSSQHMSQSRRTHLAPPHFSRWTSLSFLA